MAIINMVNKLIQYIKFEFQTMIYANFFSPPIISMLFCLHQSTVQGQEKDPRNQIVQFLIKKILSITESSNLCLTNQMFEAQMLSVTNNMQFLQKYRESISKIQSFNDFYRELSKMLKTLRSLRNNKLQQGNLIDFLVRRMYIYFQKLDFKQIIKIYHQFDQFKNGIEVNIPQHEFMLTKSIEQIKFNLQNYGPSANPEQLAKKVFELSEYDHTHKTSYLKSIVKSGQNMPIDSINSMHRYFDKSLGNLFQQKSEVNLMSNKINHCILSNAFINLRMNYLEECLQSISQGLRISQNNTDQESINNCIIYLYKISEQLGKYQEQILLNQHAITHSLNLNNILLMVYSCFNYSQFQKKYNCNDPNILLMKNRNISWTDALHFSKKKIYSTFESNCKNIYHTYRSLLIPTFMSKLSVLIHLPQLTNLLINTYYQRQELFELQIYKQFKGLTDLDKKISVALRYCKNNQTKLLHNMLQQLKKLESKALSPLEIIKIKHTINKIKYQHKSYSVCYNQTQKLAQFCQKYGFIKQQLLQTRIMSIKVLIKNSMFYDALVKIQLALKHSQLQKLKQYVVVCNLLKIQVFFYLQININQSLLNLQEIQLSSQVAQIRSQFKIIFYETKTIANKKVYELLLPNINLYEQCQKLKQNQFQTLQQILKIYLSENNFYKLKSVLFKMYDILLLNPTIIPKTKNQKIKNSLTYCEKVLNIFSTVDSYDYNENELVARIGTKLRKMYFD